MFLKWKIYRPDSVIAAVIPLTHCPNKMFAPNNSAMSMKTTFAILVITFVASVGCDINGADSPGASVGVSLQSNTPPTILGITPELQAEITRLVRTATPDADAEQVTEQYMQLLKQVAEHLKIEPDTDGNYSLRPEHKNAVKQMIAQGDIADFVAEYGIELPQWLHLLLAEHEAGESSGIRAELLHKLVYMYAIPATKQDAG